MFKVISEQMHRWMWTLHRPMDPLSLAFTRILYGLLMMTDIVHERGWSEVEERWGSPLDCRFPLFDFIKPLPVEWMHIVYLVMFLGAMNISLGLFYRLSCMCFLAAYWYIFLLDKTAWNNHSYLFGLLGFLLSIVDADRIWSLDGWRKPHMRNSHVPLWNYAIIRAQIFLVYFIAGLKKMDSDWIKGYSMENLSSHWVFDPLKFIVTEDVLNYHVIHLGGFLLDLTVGFFMLCDRTRTVAFTFCATFHLMNSQLFSIGMFPYMMLATMPIFCNADWQRGFLSAWKQPDLKPSEHCLYPSTENSQTNSKHRSTPKFYHKSSTIYFVFYIILQISLPYSHFITRGYNNWTNGLYGYSWDMMVHSWKSLHTQVTVHDMTTGKIHYLDPYKWTESNRWSSHADMAIQYGHCVKENLNSLYGMENNISLHLDVWKSINGRFQQRFFDPKVDILSYDWSPFSQVSFVMPLLTELSEWREKLQSLERQLTEGSEYSGVVFVADFPGLSLENFVSEDLQNTTLEVLSGEIEVEIGTQHLVPTQVGDRIQIPSGKFHTVHTRSSKPSCYMYLYINSTEMNMKKVDLIDSSSFNNSKNSWTLNSCAISSMCGIDATQYITTFISFCKSKYNVLRRCFTGTARALMKIVSQHLA